MTWHHLTIIQYAGNVIFLEDYYYYLYSLSSLLDSMTVSVFVTGSGIKLTWARVSSLIFCLFAFFASLLWQWIYFFFCLFVRKISPSQALFLESRFLPIHVLNVILLPVVDHPCVHFPSNFPVWWDCSTESSKKHPITFQKIIRYTKWSSTTWTFGPCNEKCKSFHFVNTASTHFFVVSITDHHRKAFVPGQTCNPLRCISLLF